MDDIGIWDLPLSSRRCRRFIREWHQRAAPTRPPATLTLKRPLTTDLASTWTSAGSAAVLAPFMNVAARRFRRATAIARATSLMRLACVAGSACWTRISTAFVTTWTAAWDSSMHAGFATVQAPSTSAAARTSRKGTAFVKGMWMTNAACAMGQGPFTSAVVQTFRAIRL